MNYKIKKIFTNVRVIIVLLFLLAMVLSIHPDPFVEGVAIRSGITNSSAYIAGIESPAQNARPMSREVITEINRVKIKDIQDYYNAIDSLAPNITIQIKTNKDLYQLVTKPLIETTILNETEQVQVEEIIEANETINGTIQTINKTINKTITQNKKLEKIIGTEAIGLSVYNAPTTNLRKGLDLEGGTRVLLEPEEKLDKDEMSILLENMKYRLNVYGLSDVVVRESSDLSGNQYILVEIAGANEEEVKELMAKQGKFESRISNQTVFKGGQDITYVCRTAECSGIDPQRGCGKSGDAWVCAFRFSISLSPEAAQRQADATANLSIITENNQEYLNEKIYLYLDNALVDELNIGADLKGKAATDIQISGSGAGKTEQEAVYSALANMKRLQTIMITGSLPVKLNIVKTDNISPVLGEEFVRSSILMGLLATLVVFIVIVARYRKLRIAIPMLITSLIETTMLMGVAALIGWSIDLAAITGVIISVGTGINDQIIITDETLRGGVSETYDWKKKLKNAFFIIIGAFLTNFVAMIPLLFAGAGLLKGFALTTMIGVTIGVMITRPAYAHVTEILLKD